MNDTIAAIATPSGTGGVAIIRISGRQSLIIAKKLARKEQIEPRKVYFSKIRNKHQQVIDEAVLLYFQAPHSFTGEDVVEIQGHGGVLVSQQILQAVIEKGARQARPGEFSERAFFNDKIDLVQAEAVADLIHAKSNAAAAAALKSLQGEFSNVINVLLEKILHLRVYVEASLDFSEEEIDFLSEGNVKSQLLEIEKQVKKIIKQASYGKLLQEGISIALIGDPNTGKSSLLNRLLGQDRAIVTDQAGTTRDTLEETILIENIPVKIIDTAGLRQTNNPVEKIGIDRTKLAIQQADYVIWLRDIHDLTDSKPDYLNDVEYLEVHNKCDQLEKETNALQISAKTGEGILELTQKIAAYSLQNNQEEGIFSARERHIQSLYLVEKHIEQSIFLLDERQPSDLIAEELRLAHLTLCEVTGEFSSDDLLGEIFSSFCVGK